MSLQARDIVRYARRNKIKITRSGVWDDNLCAKWTLSKKLFGNTEYYADETIARKAGMKTFDIHAFEMGFEGWGEEDPEVQKNRYYKVGQNVARLAGYVD